MGPQQVCWALLMGLRTCPAAKWGARQPDGEQYPRPEQDISPKDGISGTRHHMCFSEKLGGMGQSPKGMREKISPMKQPALLEQGTTRS